MNPLLIVFLLFAYGFVVFVAGARYGREEEAKAISLGLRIQSVTVLEYRAVIAKIRSSVSAEFARIKKFL